MKRRNPWLWVPSLYFTEGVPYFVVNSISVILLKRLGMGNASMAAWTSLLYLPWLIKPFWGPFVDRVKTKRWWVLSMQGAMVLLFLALALSLPKGIGAEVGLFRWTLLVFSLTAFVSATHDIAIDGFYMLGLSGKEQSLFVGIRTAFYRLSNLFVQGGVVVVAGVLELRTGNVPEAWRMTLGGLALVWALFTLYHSWALPRPAVDRSVTLRQNFSSFFRRKGVWAGLLFILLYRLPEALALKIVPAFLVDPREAGGMGLSTVDFGLVNNTVGVVGIVAGGILGGVVVSRWGLRKVLWPMALSLTLPCAVYLWMALDPSLPLPLVGACVALEQLGYGFGFTAVTLYMIHLSDGPGKTAHYALCTAFMALSMMIPGLFAGALQESVGYQTFFLIVVAACVMTYIVSALLKIDPEFGKKKA